MTSFYPLLNSGTLLFLSPEGGLVGGIGEGLVPLNRTAAEILELCSGNGTVEDIAQTIAVRHGECHERAMNLIVDFLSDSTTKGHVVLNPHPEPMLGFVAGNRDYYTPMEVSLEVTSKCCLKCIHCYAGAGPDKDIFSTEEILSLLMRIRKLGAAKIVLTGGEPFYKKGFMKILGFCCENFLAVDIATNGFLIDEKIAEQISGLRRIGGLTCRISIDGTESTHDMIRGVTGSWNRAVDSIRLLRKQSIPVSIVMTLNPSNLHEIEDVVRTARECGAGYFAVGRTLRIGQAVGRNLELTREQEIVVEKTVEKIAEHYTTNGFFVRRWVGYSDDVSQAEEARCGAVTQICHIDYLGNVTPCPSFGYCMGNVNEEELSEIYKSPLIGFLSKLRLPSRDLCGDCEHLYYCMNCHAAAYSKFREKRNCHWHQQWIESEQPIYT